MKRFVLLAIFAFSLIRVSAQEQTIVLLNYNTLQKKIEKSNAEIENPKKNMKSATWTKRAELFQDVFLLDLEQVSEGMSPQNLQLFYRDPLNIVSETDKDGNLIEKYEYAHITYQFSNGALQSWVKKDLLAENPLQEALNCYNKAIELDTKGGIAERIKPNLDELKNQLKRDGINSYYLEDYKSALKDFETVLDVNKVSVYNGEIDTLMVQYSGIICREIAQKTNDNELFKKALGYYQQLADINFGGPNTYLQMKVDYFSIGDTAKALDVLKEAYEKYPDTVNIVANIADTYIQLKKIDEGLAFIEKVNEKSPNMAEAYYWKGRMYINSEDEERIDKAVEAYKKAGELNESIYYVWYDLGYIYFLQGQDFYDRSNEENNEGRRNKLIELGHDKYQEAIPILWKAFELNDNNRDVKYETLDVLQRIYYKEQMMDKYEEVKRMKTEF